MLATVLLVVVLAACGGGTSAPTGVSASGGGGGTTGGAAPPAGTTIWSLTYRPATVSTCPAQTPDSGTASMTVDPSGNSLSLTDLGTSLGGGTATTITFAKDATGSFVWVDPTGRATIAFRFATASRADGEARRLAVPSDPCSATWPLTLTR
jgi:hypothetical protein